MNPMKLPLFSNLFEDASGAAAAFAREDGILFTQILNLYSP
jgi:hypothetical protein